jgi:C4-dicarboxylate transporter DctM subunit
MTEAPAPAPSPKVETPLQKLDGWIHAGEQGLIALALVAMTTLVSVDVLSRRVEARDSLLGGFLARHLGVTDAGTTEWLGIVALSLVGLLVAWFGLATAERRTGKKLLPIPQSALAAGALTTLGVAAVCAAMRTFASRDVYLVLYAICGAAFIADELRRKESGWQARIGIFAAVVTPIFLALAFGYFPQGYSWAKEISMMFVLWVGLVGASVCVPIGKHIRIDTLEKFLPAAAKKYVLAAGYSVTALFSAYIAWAGYAYVFGAGGSIASGATLDQTHLPVWVETLAVPVAFGLTTIRFFAAAISGLRGGSYGVPAKAEGMEEAEKAAREAGLEVKAEAASQKVSPVFIVCCALIVILPFFGNAGILASVIVLMALLGLPIFVLLGIVVIVSFMLWGGVTDLLHQNQFSFVERIVGLSDNQALLAIPFFVLSGAVMSHGEISKRLVSFSMALVGWLPGGLAVSAVLACMIFAAISGSSPATVVAIGGAMAPALIAQGYRAPFAHGLVTSAGSLGILIPPSIPMIVYAIVNQTSHMEIERLFACGYGPGLVIGAILMIMSMIQGSRDKAPRQAFSAKRVYEETRDGFWALMFPIAISVGIYSGLMNAIESACFSVVYAVVVEVFVHRALTVRQLPKILGETGILLGSFLVILVVAMTFGELLDVLGIPTAAADWVRDAELTPWQFLLVVNVLLLVVGCLLDIMSAIFIFVPLLAPMALAAGVSPYHFGIIFIVNLEIGYLTPPVGLNLFVASTMFDKPVGYMVRAVMPMVTVMLIGLGFITYSETVSVGVADLLLGPEATTSTTGAELADGEIADDATGPIDTTPDHVMTIAEMMAATETEDAIDAPAEAPMASFASLRGELDRIAAADVSTEAAQMAEPLPDLEAIIGNLREDVVAGLGEPHRCPVEGGLCTGPAQVFYSFYRLPDGADGGGPELVITFADDGSVSGAEWRHTQ